MSTALLQECYQEVRRIYVAGSDLAAQDFRLKRLLPQFEKLGERVPVFKRLGECIAEVIAPETQESHASAEKLQDLGLLLGSVLRTLGTTSVQGELREIASLPHKLSTNLSYRKLVEVERALTSTGSGRYEIVKEAFEAGMFRDLRLLPYAIDALGDPYSEIADMAEKSILPSYGPEIVPHLLASFDMAGSRVHARMLSVLAHVGGIEVSDILLQAAHSGSDEVKAVAIRNLGAYDQFDAELLNFTTAKKKMIREAAYAALAVRGTEEALNRIYEAFSSKDMEASLGAIVSNDDPKLTEMLVNGLKEELGQIHGVKEDKKKRDQIWSRIWYFLRALQDKQSQGLSDLYGSVITNYAFYQSFGWLELFDAAAVYLERHVTLDGVNQLHMLEKRNTRYLPYSFRASHELLAPAEWYERYKDMIAGKANVQAKKEAVKIKELLLETIKDMVYSRDYAPYKLSESSVSREIWLSSINILSADVLAANWDERWLDLFVRQRAMDLVCAFARPDHLEAKKLLLETAQNPPTYNSCFAGKMLQGLIRAGVEEERRGEIALILVETTHCDIYDKLVLDHLKELSPIYRDRLTAVLPKYSSYSSALLLQEIIDLLESRSVEESKV
ncbi:HEAT repeat domain-containing protein [Paenibacillus sp. 1001270B_150601_E10]|uniref:HEAT repeat domain-containing protein n=1 Tax=Paenibacillus sp. 1001270B_150601_E10 TaxID=2787079 RepID=UPI0018A0E1C7|nr:HEAT repeat domain-containing protein [Paenibacillus sp. 1001270B_150601_E10]